jgi:hypothetical protein
VSEGISLRLINYPGKRRILPTTLNTARGGQRDPGLELGRLINLPEALVRERIERSALQRSAGDQKTDDSFSRSALAAFRRC